MVDFGGRLGGGLVVLRGRDPVGLGPVACVLNHHFFDIVLGPSFFGFWSILAPNMGPKMDQKSIKNESKNQSIFFILFGSILGRFWVHFGSQNRPKIDQKLMFK